MGGYPGSTVPGAQGPLTPGGPGPVQAPLAGQSGPVASAGATGGTLAHSAVPVV